MTMSSERVERPDCDICGQPYHRHVESGVVGRICPMAVFSYRPRAAIESLSITEGEVEQRARELLAAECLSSNAAEILAGKNDLISSNRAVRAIAKAISLPSTVRGED